MTKIGKTKARGLNRSFEILDYLCASGKPLRPIDISEGMQAPKSSIYELVGILLEADVLPVRWGEDGQSLSGDEPAHEFHAPHRF